MRNIDLFDEYVALILCQLYESFPVKTTLDVRKISGHTGLDEYGRICAPDGRPSKEAEIAYSTIEWLVDSGYVRSERPNPYTGYHGCVLTSQGLEVLKATPESVKVKETTGDKLVRFVSEGSLEMAKDAAKAAITFGIGSLR